MYPDKHLRFPRKLPVFCNPLGAALATLVACVLFAMPALAQSDGGNSGAPQNQSQQDQVPAAAGGPTGESGPIAVPKKGANEEPPPPPKPKAPSEAPEYS